VFNVWSVQYELGLTHAIIIILHDSALDVNESHSTIVSLEAQKGTWIEFPAFPALFFASKARIHSLRANKDLLISAPSNHHILLLLWVSYPLSDPAKSTNISWPSFTPPHA